VRQVEAIARNSEKNRGEGRGAQKAAAKNTDTLALEKRLSDALGLLVGIDHHGDHGVVSIHYRNLDQLDDLVRRLEKKN
jgi:ParB family chromosome partitioning protein